MRRFLQLFKPRPAVERLFLTYTPEAFKVGSVSSGYVITEIRRTSDTALVGGGRAPCWWVYGRAVAPLMTEQLHSLQKMVARLQARHEMGSTEWHWFEGIDDLIHAKLTELGD